MDVRRLKSARVSILGIALLHLAANAALAQQLPMPFWPSSNKPGCIGFCAALTSPLKVSAFGQIEKNSDISRVIQLDPVMTSALARWQTESAILDSISDDRQTANIYSAAGYTLKYVGTGIKSANVKGLSVRAQIGATLIGTAMVDLGEYTARQAAKNLTTAIILKLNKKFDTLVAPDGVVNTDVLANIPANELNFIHDAAFLNELGDPRAVQEFIQQVNTQQLTTILQKVKKIDLSVENSHKKLIAELSAVKEIRSATRKLVDMTKQTQATLSDVNKQVTKSGVLIEALAENLPNAQKLALVHAGVLAIGDTKALARLEQTVRAEEFQSYFIQTSNTLKGFAPGIAALDPQLAQSINQVTNLLNIGGGLAASYVTGNPIGLAQGGINLMGAIAGFGKSAGPSPEQEMLGQVLKELAQLRQEVYQYHVEEMKALSEISAKLDHLQNVVEKRFKELALDVDLVQLDTRELLQDSVRACDRLDKDYRSLHVDSEADGLHYFGAWFGADGRREDFSKCLTGLIDRQAVKSEIDFSGLLRSDIVENPVGGAGVDERRTAVRRLELGVLKPTVSYIRQYNDTSDSRKIADKLYAPVFTTCDVVLDAKPTVCPFGAKFEWPRSAIAQSQYNPGQGSILSANAALTLARHTRNIAQWNSVLVDDVNKGLRVLSLSELEKLTPANAALNTRHLLAIQNSIKSLDLNIAQSMVLLGSPSLDRAATVLSEQVIPAYARSRLLKDTSKINDLLPRYQIKDETHQPTCATGKEAWDTLCLMQVNSLFAENVIKVLITKRLSGRNASWDDWRRAIRSPFSDAMQKLLGNDVLLADVSDGYPARFLGAWAIELPRVNTQYYSKNGDVNCWSQDIKVPPNKKEEKDNRVAKAKDAEQDGEDFYSKADGGLCHVVDGFATQSFVLLATPSNYNLLVQERAMLSALLNKYCSSLPQYSEAYCRVPSGIWLEFAEARLRVA